MNVILSAYITGFVFVLFMAKSSFDFDCDPEWHKWLCAAGIALVWPVGIAVAVVQIVKDYIFNA